MRLYKVLTKELKSPFMDFRYEIGREYVCEGFDENPKNECSRGFYATDIQGLLYSFNTSREVWLVDVGGKRVEIDEYKRRYERIKVLEKVSHSKVRELAVGVEKEVGYKLGEALFPVNPLLIQRATEVTQEEVRFLEAWASVEDSVGDSVWASVWASVLASVRVSVWASVRASGRDSVWASVLASVRRSVRDSVETSGRDSVEASVGDSVWAYIGSLFPIRHWKYVQHEPGSYPFQPAVDLWYAGLVPSFDGENWRLHAGKEGRVIYKSEEAW